MGGRGRAEVKGGRRKGVGEVKEHGGAGVQPSIFAGSGAGHCRSCPGRFCHDFGSVHARPCALAGHAVWVVVFWAWVLF